MRKIMAIVLPLLFVGGVAIAAVTTGTFGDQNSSKVYRMIVDSDGVITVAADSVLYNKGNLGLGISAPTQRLAVDGLVYFTPASLSAQTGVTGAKFLKINTDGTIYASAN